MFLNNQNLRPWILEILNHCTPVTEHKQLLNSLSLQQITDSTYMENTLPNVASDANFIVPRSLYECKTNQMWRYPPHIYADFAVEASENDFITITIRFAIPRFIRYGERLQKSGRHFKKKPTLPIPTDFGNVALFGRTYNMELDQELSPTSVKPKLYEDTIKIRIRDILDSPGGEKLENLIELEEQVIVVKKFDSIANEVLAAEGEDPSSLGYEPIKADSKKENANIGYVELVYGPSRARLLIGATRIDTNKFRISLRLTNEQTYKKDNPIDKRIISLPH